MGAETKTRWPGLFLVACVVLGVAVWLTTSAPGTDAPRTPARALRAGEPLESARSEAADALRVIRAPEAREPMAPSAPEPRLSTDVRTESRIEGKLTVATPTVDPSTARITLSEGIPGAVFDEGFSGGRAPRTLATATPDRTGHFDFPAPGLGPFTVALEHPELVAVPTTGVEPGDFVNLSAEPAATLSGKILSTATGSAIEGAEVRLFLAGEDETRIAITTGSGEFTFSRLVPGEAGLFALAKGHRKCPWTELVLEPGPNALDPLSLDEGRAVRGVVRDARSNAPIAGAEVSTWSFIGRRAVADDQGRFVVWGAGELGGEVVARAPGYGASKAAFGAETKEVEVLLWPEVRVLGVVRGPDGQVCPDARVAILPRWASGAPAFNVGRVEGPKADGAFKISGVSWDFDVVAWGPEGTAGPRSIELKMLPILNGDLGLRDMGELRLGSPEPELPAPPAPATAPVTGTVLGPGGQPVAKARVWLRGTGWGRVWRTDDAGRFRFEEPPCGGARADGARA